MLRKFKVGTIDKFPGFRYNEVIEIFGNIPHIKNNDASRRKEGDIK